MGDLVGELHVRTGSTQGIVFEGTTVTGTISSDGPWSGAVTAGFDMRARIEIPGDADLWLHVGRYEPWYPEVDFRGRVIVGGDMLGFINVKGDWGDPNDTFAGSVMINGSFLAPDAPSHIKVDGQVVGAGTFLAVNYDAHDGGVWDPNAVVIIGDPNDPNNVHNGNTPALHLWETKCKGDMDGDQVVSFPDINPFILALTNAVGYSEYFPGLGCTNDPNDPNCLAGSRIWRGDLTCDNPPHLGFEDINPFVVLLTDPCCQPTCDPCSGDGGERMSPQQLASELAATIWPELYNDLVAIVEENIDLQPDEESQAYWEAVHAALTG